MPSTSPSFSGEIGVGQHVVAESVLNKRIQAAVVAEESPIQAQLLGTKHQHPLVLEFKILDDREGL